MSKIPKGSSVPKVYLFEGGKMRTQVLSGEAFEKYSPQTPLLLSSLALLIVSCLIDYFLLFLGYPWLKAM